MYRQEYILCIIYRKRVIKRWGIVTTSWNLATPFLWQTGKQVGIHLLAGVQQICDSRHWVVEIKAKYVILNVTFDSLRADMTNIIEAMGDIQELYANERMKKAARAKPNPEQNMLTETAPVQWRGYFPGRTQFAAWFLPACLEWRSSVSCLCCFWILSALLCTDSCCTAYGCCLNVAICLMSWGVHNKNNSPKYPSSFSASSTLTWTL